MPDEIHRRSTDQTLRTRMSLLERDVENLTKRHDDHLLAAKEVHSDFWEAIRKLDDRTDQLTLRVTQAFTIVAVVWALVVVLAPMIQGVLRLPTGN